MDMNQLAKLFSELCMMFALLGLILYLPLKPHWSKIFSFWDGLLLYCGIGAPILYIYLFSLDFEVGIGAILTGIIVGGGFAIAGLVTLIKCWTLCGNLLEALFLPFIMLMMVGVFCLGLLCLLLALVGIFQRPYLTWDSFE